MSLDLWYSIGDISLKTYRERKDLRLNSKTVTKVQGPLCGVRGEICLRNLRLWQKHFIRELRWPARRNRRAVHKKTRCQVHRGRRSLRSLPLDSGHGFQRSSEATTSLRAASSVRRWDLRLIGSWRDRKNRILTPAVTGRNEQREPRGWCTANFRRPITSALVRVTCPCFRIEPSWRARPCQLTLRGYVYLACAS